MDENPHVPVACSTILFRAIPYDNLVRKNGEHREGVFIRRSASDPHGLSVATTIQACKDLFARPNFGVRSLHVGRLRDYGLEIFPTAPEHGNIRHSDGTNIPTRLENEIDAKNIASDLMEMSRPISHWAEEDADERFRELRSESQNSN